MSSRKATLCVDGGASRARAMLVCESERLFSYMHLGLNPRLLSAREFERRLENLILPLLRKIRPQPETIKATLALAGAGSREMRVHCGKLARDALGRSGATVKVRIMADVDVLVEALLEGEDGIVIVAGTGSVCVGVRHESGGLQKVRVGGWGSSFDLGCGLGVGQRALRQALWEIDAERPSRLTLMILDYYKCKPHELSQVVSGWDVRKIAEAAMVVAEAYSLGSRSAREIWRSTATEITSLICVVHAKTKLPGEFPIYATGGLFQDRPLVRLVRRELRKMLPRATFSIVKEPMLKLIYELTA